MAKSRDLTFHPKWAGLSMTPLEAWDMLFCDKINAEIALRTNAETNRRRQNLNVIQTYHKDTDHMEIRAFIGFLYLTGVHKASHLNIDELYSNRNGHFVFKQYADENFSISVFVSFC